MAKPILTQSRLKELFHYDPETGVFTRLKSRSSNTKAGDMAGCDNRCGYFKIRIDDTLYYSHRLAFLYMNGIWPKDKIDHINHNGYDNRWDNLRQATYQTNNKNMSMRKDNSSGITGVSWNKRRNKWVSQIQVDGKNISLGRFDLINDAIDARKKAEKLYGFHKNHGINL